MIQTADMIIQRLHYSLPPMLYQFTVFKLDLFVFTFCRMSFNTSRYLRILKSLDNISLGQILPLKPNRRLNSWTLPEQQDGAVRPAASLTYLRQLGSQCTSTASRCKVFTFSKHVRTIPHLLLQSIFKGVILPSWNICWVSSRTEMIKWLNSRSVTQPSCTETILKPWQRQQGYCYPVRQCHSYLSYNQVQY